MLLCVVAQLAVAHRPDPGALIPEKASTKGRPGPREAQSAHEAAQAQSAEKADQDPQVNDDISGMGQPGWECFGKCDQKAGRCPQFCAGPTWSGSCCRLGAVGPLGAPECENRGCTMNHCCVQDAPEDIEKAEGAAGSEEPVKSGPNMPAVPDDSFVPIDPAETERKIQEEIDKAAAAEKAQRQAMGLDPQEEEHQEKEKKEEEEEEEEKQQQQQQ